MKLTLNALFDYTDNDGIFTYLNQYDVPWKEDVDADLLDLDYHSKYGTRIVSKTVTSLLTTDGLPAAKKSKLAKLAYSKNKAKWDELWRTLGLYDDFNVLDNTDWEESVTVEHEGEDAKTQNVGQKVTQFSKGEQQNTQTKGQELDTTVHGAQSKSYVKGNQISTYEKGAQSNTIGSHTDQIGGQTVTTSEDKYAFNSSSASHDSAKSEQISSRSDTIGSHTDSEGAREDRTSEGQRTDSESSTAFTDTLTTGSRSDSQTEGARSDSQTEGAQQNTESGTNAFSETTTTSRHGNIGVTTAGQLIRDFRVTVNWNFFETVYADLNELLVIEVYGKEDDDLDDYTIITNYVLPIASASVLGGIKVGNNLTIGQDGTLSAQIEGGGVSSVNGKTGDVTLTASDVGAATPSDIKVNSVNNKTGDVTLSASDVGAATQSDIQTAIQGIVFPVVKVNNKTGDITLSASDVGAATSQDIQNAIANVRQVPTGGTTDQVLTKTADGYGWANSQGGGGSSDELIVVSGHDITVRGSSTTLFDADTVLYKSGNDFITYNLNNGFFTVTQTTYVSIAADGSMDNAGSGWITFEIDKCTTPNTADYIGHLGTLYWNYTFGYTEYPIVKLEPGFYYCVSIYKANSGNFTMAKTAYNPTVNEYQVKNFIKFKKKSGVYLPT